MNKPFLKPCPFCGGPASIFVVKQDDHPDRYEANCENDGCVVSSCTMMYDTKEHAAAAWNKRASE